MVVYVLAFGRHFKYLQTTVFVIELQQNKKIISLEIDSLRLNIQYWKNSNFIGSWKSIMS